MVIIVCGLTMNYKSFGMHLIRNYHLFIFKAFFVVGLLLVINGNLSAQTGVTNYKVCFGVGDSANKLSLVLRKFEQSGKLFYIAVDPDKLETRIIPSDQISIKPLEWQQILFDYKNTAYVKAILTAQSQSFSLQNSGIIHGFPKEKGVTLTIDLCPSHKPLDRIIFTSLISEFQNIEKPVPLALSITGQFMLTHPKDLTWLKGLITSGDISVTWINHTYNHYFNPLVPLRDNFLLEPHTNLNFEILETEIALLQEGFLFSVFFRFPGLVSDHQIVDKVTGYGLIPIGSDAWLAKGQKASAGSIVLIHGNGNEPIGVKDFITLIRTEQSSVLKKEWLIYDLRESVENEFQQ